MAAVEVKVPDIGDFDTVEVIEVLVKVGDRIEPEQSLVTVESDKASMEIPSSVAGVVEELRVKVGDKVSEGSTLLMVEEAEGQDRSGAPAKAVAPAAKTVAEPAASAAAAPPASQAAAPAAAPTPAPSSSGGEKASASSIDVVVPDIGDFDEVAVIEVLVEVGDRVDVEQSLITVESDKASMEIPSSAAGTVESLAVKVGDKVAKGSRIAVVKGENSSDGKSSGASADADAQAEADRSPTEASAAAATPSFAPQPSLAATPASAASPGTAASAAASPLGERQLPTAALPAHEPSAPRGPLPHASPTIRKLARELGVPLEEVQGSGPKGRITQDDVQAFVKAVMSGGQATKAQTARQVSAGGAGGAGGGAGAWAGLPAWPQVDFAKFGPIERKELSRIRKISGPALLRNWVSIPHVTNHDDADITDLEVFRVATNKENEKSGVKVTMLAFLIKASVAAMKKFPEFNASLESTSAGEQLVLKQYFHIGFAADTPNGLVVPVIRDCDKKGMLQISQEMSELAKKARDGKLSPPEMSGGCFSISSLGGIGGRYFTPIINAPEVAILGVCRSAIEPKWDGKAFQPRLMLPLSLSWDHRVIDGAAAARFNAYLAQILGDFRRVLL